MQKLYDINSVILMTDSDNHNDKEKKIRIQMTVKKSRIINNRNKSDDDNAVDGNKRKM